MTASLPQSFDSPADEPGTSSAEPTGESPRIIPTPRPPKVTAVPRPPGSTGGKPARAPRPKRTPRGPKSGEWASVTPPDAVEKPRPVEPAAIAAEDLPPAPEATPPITPGPPPPLPAGLVIPPRPPLPPVPPLPADLAAPISPEQETPAPTAVEAEPEPAVEAEPEPVVEAEPEPVVEAEPIVAPEPVDEPEPVVEAEPVVEVEPVVEAEPEPVVEAEPEPVVEAEPDPVVAADPELPAGEIEPAPELEPQLQPDSEPAASVAPEPEPVALVDAPAHGADAAPAALELRGVSKSFGGAPAVDAIDLTVPVGSFYGLVGPNGAGKTTTLSMIAGLLRADSGSISVAGVDAARNPAAAKRLMGVLPDRLRTFDRLTGRQLLYYYGVLRGLSSSVVEARTADLARAFDLAGALGRPVSDYSAGMTKKVMLAGAMIHSPRLLVLDEPFEAVDPVSSSVILDILGAYVANGGTVILSSHGMELVERVCSRVAVIVGGRVLAEGTVDEVRGESTLEQRFIELAGGTGDVEGLEWLHTFSD